MSVSSTSKLVRSSDSESTIVIPLTRSLVHDQFPVTQHEEDLADSTNFTPSEQTISDLNELKDALNIASLKDLQLQGAQFDFITALTSIKYPSKFKQYITSSYNKCSVAISKPHNIRSYDKIFAYSLLISSAFIYHSDYGIDYLKGLTQIYTILKDMNSDHQLRKDLMTALKSRVFLTDNERKLIHESVYFAIRTNAFIKDIQKHIETLINDDEKQDNVPCMDVSWIPTYYNGYYFGLFGDRYPILSTKAFRKIMNEDKASHRVCVDDVMIHTHDLVNAGIYAQQDKKWRVMHHWFGRAGFMDLNCIEDIKVKVRFNHNRQFHAIVFNKYDRVNMVKNVICNKYAHIAVAMMKIECNKQELHDHDTLFDYKISNDCFLKVSVRASHPFL